MRDPPLLTREYICSRIDAGEKLVIFQDLVLKLDSWIDFHPGGEKPILHMVGIDATDPIIV